MVDLLNEATLNTKDDAARLASLKLVQTLILHKNPTLLDNFLDVTDWVYSLNKNFLDKKSWNFKEILQFQVDKSNEIKKFVVSFIEEAWWFDLHSFLS